MIHRRTLQALISKINYDDKKELFLETVIISEPLQYRQHAFSKPYNTLYYITAPTLPGKKIGETRRTGRENMKEEGGRSKRMRDKM